jgi:hypothetical protein
MRERERERENEMGSLRERVCVLAKGQMDKKALQPYMRVLGTNSSGSTIGPSENYGH